MKIKNAIKAVFIFSIAILMVNCETEKLATDESANQAKTILSAHTWFNQYESNGKNYDLVQNLQYDWDQASITASEDGTQTIIVPVTELKKEQSEIWQQKLYIYKLDDQKYEASLIEIYPNKNAKLEDQSIEGTNFAGIISVWDLKSGFVKSARFKDNEAIEKGIVEFLPNGKSATSKAPIILPCTDGGCIDGGGTVNGGELRDVVIPSKSNTQPTPVVIYIPSSPVNGGTNPGGYVSHGSGNGGGGTPTTAANPCDKIKVLMANPNFIVKLEELLKKTNLKVETGYSQSKNGPFTSLTVAASTGSTDALSLNTTPDMVGYVHSHLDNYETGETNADGNPLIRNPIRMFSPADVGIFLKLVKNAQANNISTENIYGTMVSSEGTYQLKFTGDVSQININFNWTRLTKDYEKYFVDRNGNTISGEKKEAQFLNFLNEKGYLTGIELYKINKDNTSTKKSLDTNKKIINTNC